MRIHKLPDSPVEIAQLSGEDMNLIGADYKLLSHTWVCLEDIIEALNAPDPWSDPVQAYLIAQILEREILDG